MKFLSREIKQDGVGLYFCYGPFRIRPRIPKNTRFNLEEEVYMIPDWISIKDRHEDLISTIVFRSVDYYEIWKSKNRS